MPAAQLIITLLSVTLTIVAGTAGASTIVSPVAVVQNTLGEIGPTARLGNAFDQSGLSAGYTSGVTDFDLFLGADPTHTFIADNNEWFAAAGVTSGVIDLDLGSLMVVDRVAIWNEDGTGVQDLRIHTSNDSGFASSTLVGTFTLTDNPAANDYLADVLDLTVTSARYVRFEILSAYSSPLVVPTASLGEVAFSTGPIPEPTASLLFAAGLLLVGRAVRRRAA